MTKRVALLVGTRKGLFVLDGDPDRETWDVRGPLCDGWPIHDAIAAGTGRVAVPLAQAGHRVVGVDLDPAKRPA